MNEWIEKSVELANSSGYLDRLHEIYPVTLDKPRVLSEDKMEEIKEAYCYKDIDRLLHILLKLEKFPIKDPYVAFFKEDEKFVALNPATANRIATTLYSMEFDEIIKGIEKAKEFNRQIGRLFIRWIKKAAFLKLAWEDFIKCNNTAILDGSGAILCKFAKEILDIKLDKYPDLIAKVKDTYIIGEAKFITAYGGHQDRQLDDVIKLIHNKQGKAIRIGIVDGVVWIRNNKKMFRIISNIQNIMLSALLLNEFLQSLL